ncbi:MAG: hypothetical protein IKZ41_03380 [Clostridia bacterium]|nr:hypothetical protein [Clostridia bacterium]MBR5365810.1 hypothetical protein [Clostridia bacterium]
MKKTLLLSLLLVFLLIVSCGKADTPAEGQTADNTGTAADAADAAPDASAGTPDANAPEAAPEAVPAGEPAAEAAAEPAGQGELPFTTDGAHDLSGDILYWDFELNDGDGKWFLGDDGTQMSDPLTEDLLREYRYFVVTYECGNCDADSQIALMFKYHHDDDTKTEYLCNAWQQWGPAGMTFQASEFATDTVYEEGAFYVPTSLFLENENYRAGDIIDQMGFAAVEWSGTYVSLTITGAYLAK